MKTVKFDTVELSFPDKSTVTASGIVAWHVEENGKLISPPQKINPLKVDKDKLKNKDLKNVTLHYRTMSVDGIIKVSDKEIVFEAK